MDNERIAIRFVFQGKDSILKYYGCKISAYLKEYSFGRNKFQANDVPGFSYGDIDSEGWYRESDALSGMKFHINKKKSHIKNDFY